MNWNGVYFDNSRNIPLPPRLAASPLECVILPVIMRGVEVEGPTTGSSVDFLSRMWIKVSIWWDKSRDSPHEHDDIHCSSLFSTPPSLFKPPTWNVLLTKQDVKLLRRVLAQPGSFKVSENHFSLQIVSLHLVWHDVQMFAHIQSCQPIRMDLTSFVDKSSMHILDQKKSNLNVENV